MFSPNRREGDNVSLDDEELSDLLRRNATRHVAPQRLRASIRAQVTLAAVSGATRPPRSRPHISQWLREKLPTGAAAFALGALFAVFLLPAINGLGAPTQELLVENHVKALSVGPLTEVVSSDRHTVRPWFQGKIDYAPPVLDLSADGFPLVGGRLERVQGQRVAALTYRHNLHIINLYVWPENRRPRTASKFVYRGFNVLTWTVDSMEVWAVSDMTSKDLNNFSAAWTEHAHKEF